MEQDKASNITGISQLGRDNDGRYFQQSNEDAKEYLTANREKIGINLEMKTTEVPVAFSKTDAVLATTATVALNSEECCTPSHELAQEEPFNSTEKAIEIANQYYPVNDNHNDMDRGVERD